VIDLHCHILPGIDDGAPDLATSLEMARIAVADGIEVTACTPHIQRGVYDNDGPAIKAAIGALRIALEQSGIPLGLISGADTHIDGDLVDGLRSGRVASLNDSAYFLFEPPHHVAPPRMEDVVFDVMAAGYWPVLTHPERLTWIETHYDAIERMAGRGVLMQITAGSIEGRFGKRPLYWAERMLDEGLVHILATDAHNLRNRKPVLSVARELVAKRLGEAEATAMVTTRPAAIVANLPPRPLARRERDKSPSLKRTGAAVLSWLGLG
jgi:protein-tyrosine phosphatase